MGTERRTTPEGQAGRTRSLDQLGPATGSGGRYEGARVKAQAEAASQRITGWSLEEWEAKWARARQRAVETGELDPRRLYREAEMARLNRICGLEGEDWIAVQVSTDYLMRTEPGYTPPTWAGITARRAIRWKLDPERFKGF